MKQIILIQKNYESQLSIMLKIKNILQKYSSLLSMQPKKNQSRRDKLLEFQARAQLLWQRENFFKAEVNYNKPKYFQTFPYPYMNGRLHLGHGFSMTKCDFNARYKVLAGYNVLFPFGFHCTGMPICAAAEKLKYQLENYGNPPVLNQEGKKKYYQKQTQYQILIQMGIPKNLIQKFTDPVYWCHYFPPIGKTDLKRFGVFCDFDRSFITTSINPYYNSFIEWQFTKLKQRGYIKFGKRPSIYSAKDKQICADHDRAEGQGVCPQQFTLIKLQIIQLNEVLKQKLAGRKVFLVAATLRPETMYGQTNCYLLPTGQYGAYQMKDDEIFICSQRSATNMAYQSLTRTDEIIQKVATYKGQDLLGLKLKAPLSKYQVVYSLPMMTITMDKGTGVVTSVPSDAPDDWAALNDLRNKKALRDKFKITEDMVKLDPVQIINIPGLGNLSALKACQQLKIKGQNDKDLLAKAKDLCYLKGFYQGRLLVGKYVGTKVQDAKLLVKKDLIESKEALTYYQPDGKVVARSGDQCVVTFCDQWYINYADEKWQNKVMDHLQTNFKTNTPNVQQEFVATVKWIHEWACSRSFGLGTKLPFDDRYVIQSLSDSTIYMAYYTIAYLLQGSINGDVPGILGIKASELNNNVWEYIFLKGQYKGGSIPQYKLKMLREQFNYWYPMDLRCSAKDLIKNHLTMSLFIHTAIWQQQPEKWPRGFYCNGYINVNSQKMSKSKGNFKIINEICQEYGADASRLACASSGDTLDDANFTYQNANSAILQLSTIEMYYAKAVQHFKSFRQSTQGNSINEYYDNIFLNQMYQIINKTLASYQEMRFRDVVKYAVYELTSIKDQYLINCQLSKPRKDLMEIYLYWQLLVIYPICPHFGQIVYLDHFLQIVDGKNKNYPKYLGKGTFPEITQKINHGIIKSHGCIKSFLSSMREAYAKALKFNKKNPDFKFKKATIIYRKNYQPFQIQVLKLLRACNFDSENQTKDDWRSKLTIQDKEEKTKALKFGSFILKDVKTRGVQALEQNLPFDQKQLFDIFYENIKKQFGMEIQIIQVNEVQNKDKFWNDTIANVNPGKAQSIFQ